MDNGTRAVYEKAIELYEMYLRGESVNVIDPDGSIPSKKTIGIRLQQLKQAIS